MIFMFKREAEETIKNISETFRVLLVTGPRQVGKTTLLKEFMPQGMNYLMKTNTLTKRVFRYMKITMT